MKTELNHQGISKTFALVHFVTSVFTAVVSMVVAAVVSMVVAAVVSMVVVRVNMEGNLCFVLWLCAVLMFLSIAFVCKKDQLC
jgi:hypothetical protein